MSKTIHGLWLPASVSPAGTALALWGEDIGAARTRPDHDHPFSLSSQAIEFALFNLCAVRPDGLRRGQDYLTLALPSDDEKPLPSLQALAGRSAEDETTPVAAMSSLRPWRVEVCYLAADAVLEFLLQLPAGSSSVVLGASLRFWVRAARFVAAALIRGQFVPSADERGQGRWQLLLAEAELQAVAARLAQAMPASARALARPMPPAGELLDHFISTLTGHYLTQAYAPGKTPFYDPGDYSRGRQALRPADQWWMDLFPHKNHYLQGTVGPEDRMAFGEIVRAWSMPVQHYIASPYRVAFRLEPPAATTRTEPGATEWRLSFHLQPKAEPDRLWAAAEVWENAVDPEMPALLRAGLAQASLLYLPLAACLRDPRPAELMLDVDQAFEFLKRQAAELSARGFGVLVPTWWKDRVRRVKTRLVLGQSGEPSGLLGMDALVDFNWQLAVDDRTLTPEEFLALAQSKTALVQVRGEWVQLDPADVQAALQLAGRLGKSMSKLSLREALSLALAVPTEWEGLDVDGVEVSRWLDQLAWRLADHQPLERLPQPARFVGQLRPYQLNGYSWLDFMRRWGFGACLADDMGLGKTVMTLALFAKDLDEDRFHRPVLLVCPTTVVNNWMREASRFVPALHCYAHHGPRRFKGEEFERVARDHHLVVTSYALLPRDREFIGAVKWGGVVLDEAHNVKNPSTKAAQAARQVKAGFRIALTGTPIENRLQDLWSIMHFLNPGYLGSAEAFHRHFAGPIERGTDPQAATRLRVLTGPFILRRLKTDRAIIQDLPPKNEIKEYCGLTKEQAALYRAVVQESLRQIAGADGIRRRGIILATLTRLKQVCNHPRHLLGDQSPLRNRSGKLNRLTEMLEEALAEDDRVLIFTQYAEMGALLHGYLTEAFGETLFLHGGTPARRRAEMIELFQDGGPRLFVLSLKAGGAGINLTRANRVFHYDRWWNPAVEDQATDRAFRIGQTQTVQVHKMICRGTVEERVDELITRKSALAGQIVGSGENWLTELTTDELRDLLRLQRDAVDD